MLQDLEALGFGTKPVVLRAALDIAGEGLPESRCMEAGAMGIGRAGRGANTGLNTSDKRMGASRRSADEGKLREVADRHFKGKASWRRCC
jgi:hypothetical protein